ncbi:hypothetical protein Tco_0508907 [Tanacetum coccineum]
MQRNIEYPRAFLGSVDPCCSIIVPSPGSVVPASSVIVLQEVVPAGSVSFSCWLSFLAGIGCFLLDVIVPALVV